LCAGLLLACSSSQEAAGSNGASGQDEPDTGTTGGSAGATTASGGNGGGAGAGTGGTAGTAGSAQSAGAGGSSQAGGGGTNASDSGSDGDATAGGDQQPWRALNVVVPPGIYKHQWKPSDADPMCVQQNATQYSGLNTTRPMIVGKLLVDLGFNQGELLDYFLHGGFHVLALDFAGVNEVPDIVVAGTQNPDEFGNIRLEALEGVDHTPLININYHDSLEGHLIEGLKYLQKQYPDEDWGYYLNQDGSVRYSDVILTGLSHGATSAARFGMVRRLDRVVSSSGPRDNTCGTDPACATGVIATWFKEIPKTPIDRFYGITGTLDIQYPEILFAMERLGYVGSPTNVLQVPSPYGGSHRLFAVEGHARFCNDVKYAAACNYMFGVPAANQ
jgi:hypothetical protein